MTPSSASSVIVTLILYVPIKFHQRTWRWTVLRSVMVPSTSYAEKLFKSSSFPLTTVNWSFYFYRKHMVINSCFFSAPRYQNHSHLRIRRRTIQKQMLPAFRLRWTSRGLCLRHTFLQWWISNQSHIRCSLSSTCCACCSRLKSFFLSRSNKLNFRIRSPVPSCSIFKFPQYSLLVVKKKSNLLRKQVA